MLLLSHLGFVTASAGCFSFTSRLTLLMGVPYVDVSLPRVPTFIFVAPHAPPS
jgi:hypothetical protein